MVDFRKTFFQLLLIILALAFTLCIRYISSGEEITAGTFGEYGGSNLTLSDIFEKCVPAEDGK